MGCLVLSWNHSKSTPCLLVRHKYRHTNHHAAASLSFKFVPAPLGATHSDDSSAQGRGLSSATTVYLQAPPQTVLPKPEHRPNCRCPVNNYRVVVGKSLSWREWEWDGHSWPYRTPNASLCHTRLRSTNNTLKNDFFALFLVFFVTYIQCFAHIHSRMTNIRYGM